MAKLVELFIFLRLYKKRCRDVLTTDGDAIVAVFP